MSISAFRKRESLTAASFHRWRAKLASQPAPFVEPAVPSRTRAATPAWTIELELPGASFCAFSGSRMFPEMPLQRILAHRTPVDMRKSFDGLIALVKGALTEDPIETKVSCFEFLLD